MYRGHYHGTQRHTDDLDAVLERAREVGCQRLIVTGSDLPESKSAVELGKSHPGFVYCTVGVHPCSCLSFTKHPTDASKLLSELKDLAIAAKESGQCVAFGEIGLDYDRLTLCPKDVQLDYFAKQLDVAIDVDLPLFLHSRAAAADFAALLRERLDRLPKRGVVHSFTGTAEEMTELVDMGFDIGINGCSMKTAENIEVVKAVPLARLQLETDGPWCEMRPSHASAAYLKDIGDIKWKSSKKEKWTEGTMVKGRNEPCMIGRVAWAVAGIKGMSVEALTEKAWENTVKMFSLDER